MAPKPYDHCHGKVPRSCLAFNLLTKAVLLTKAEMAGLSLQHSASDDLGPRRWQDKDALLGCPKSLRETFWLPSANIVIWTATSGVSDG